MDYFRIIQLDKEPFSNSPDPDYFFRSRQHVECLQKLELALRLRRGLNVVVGDVGTGKTTLCRELIRRFSEEKDCETHLILDPCFSSPPEFLAAVAEMFTGTRPPLNANDWQLKEIIKTHLLRKGVDQNRIVVLIIDEGQKIPDFCLEILREFLNFETNDYKLLQIALFAQNELGQKLERFANFADRINLYHTLRPLSFQDTCAMIRFRIRQASATPRPPALFSLPALWLIYRASGGFPRKIVNLCHSSILAMIIQNRTRAGWRLVGSCLKRSFSVSEQKPKGLRTAAAALVSLAGILLIAAALATHPRIAGLFENWRSGLSIEPAGPVAAEVSAAPQLHQAQDPSAAEPTGPTVAVRGAAGERASETAVQSDTAEKKIPTLLGQVALKRNESLWRLIMKVYGEFSDQHQNLILAANPQIANPNEIRAGQLISVPAIRAAVKPPSEAVWWVRLEEKARLDEAMQVLRAYPNGLLPIRMLPYWDPAAELRFAILLRKHFADEMTAKNQLAQLPPEFSETGDILTGWTEGTIFFGDPYSAKK